MTEITMATRDWTWQDLCWPSSSEGEPLATVVVRVSVVHCLYSLFRNLTKEVRLYAQKFIDRGRVSHY